MVMDIITNKTRLPIASPESLPLPDINNNNNNEAKLAIIHRCLDYARRHLVTAMKYGYLSSL